MAKAKPENKFIARVHKHLPKEIFHEKTNNPWVAGILDVHYEYMVDMFVEYKWLPKRKEIITLVDPGKKPHVSYHQGESITRREEFGLPVALILGVPGGGIIFEGDSYPKEEFSIAGVELLTDQEIANWIACMLYYDVSDITIKDAQYP